MKTTYYAKDLVFQELDRMLELGGDQELHRIERISKYSVQSWITEFQRTNAFKLNGPVTDHTIGRYMEKWLKKKLTK